MTSNETAHLGVTFETILRRGPVPLVAVDARGVLRLVTARAAQVLSAAALPGTLLADLVSPRDRSALTAFLDELATADPSRSVFFSVTLAQADRTVDVSGTNLLLDPAVGLMALLVTDVTEARRREAELARRALYDQLTGLPNRALFLDRIRAQWHAETGAASVAVIDLDNFKSINDVHGHAAGDALLAEVAARMTHSLPDDVTVARVGGDEFFVLLPGRSGEQSAHVLSALLDAVAQPAVVTSGTVQVTAAVGVADLHGSAEETLACADQAMYRAKTAGSQAVVVFSSDLPEQGRRDVGDRLGRLQREKTEMAREARTDALTGLPNRRAFDEAVDALARRYARTGEPYAAMFVDLDRFGAYNHRHGDAAGDTVLRKVAEAVASACRRQDTAFRKGGEELVVLLPGTDADDAPAVAERVRAGVEALGLPHGGHPDVPVVTVSVAVACSNGADEVADVVDRAARAAFEAKVTGRRNRVSIG